MWAQRARTAEEAARTAPTARGVRVLLDHFEQLDTREIQVEGHYRRCEESIDVSRDDWRSESLLVTKSQTTGAWVINAELWPELGFLGAAEEWLAALLWRRSKGPPRRRRRRRPCNSSSSGSIGRGRRTEREAEIRSIRPVACAADSMRELRAAAGAIQQTGDRSECREHILPRGKRERQRRGVGRCRSRGRT